MAQTGFTPIQIYSSSTPTNAPSAGNLTNDTKGSELAINIADKNLFFKDSTNAVNTVPIRQSSTSSNGWLSSTDWNTFNSKQAALVSGVNIKTVNGTTLLGSGDLGTIGVAYGGTGASSAGIASFNNITGYTASGATGTTSTNLVFSTSPTLTTPKATTTIGVGDATPAASGAGITFPATASASSDVNTLDDYEEGTWTPQYTFATSGTATMVTSSGAYTKIGRMVTVNFIAVTSAVSSPTGAATITGLPFTSAASGEAGGAIGEVRRFATDMPNLKLDVNPSSSAINLLKQATNSSANTAVDGADFSGTANFNRLHGTITYFV